VEEKDVLEHITRALYYFEVHLLYASIVWLAAWVLTSIPLGSATTKYWIWVATSLNFIFPVGAILDTFWASHLSWAAPLGIIGDVASRISRSPAAAVLGAVWVLGAILMLTRVCSRIRAERRDTRATAFQGDMHPGPDVLAHGVPVRFTMTRQAPAVHGILRPHISLPDGIDRLLSEQELNAVLVHEFTHAKRRDNLIRLIHEVGLCGLWFHPLVWIAGSRIALYRELSCDESVVQSAHGGDLVSALAKLASPEEAFLLQATASSFMSRRLAGLAASQPRRSSLAANTLLTVVFIGALLAGVFGTVSHTACCFVARL
jgi:beta-lactamase regulating signal transducer with metallopeptidase domain